MLWYAYDDSTIIQAWKGWNDLAVLNLLNAAGSTTTFHDEIANHSNGKGRPVLQSASWYLDYGYGITIQFT